MIISLVYYKLKKKKNELSLKNKLRKPGIEPGAQRWQR